MVAGMMNPLFLATRSLNACVRSTRTHSSCLSTDLLSHVRPTDCTLYCKFCIQSSVYTLAYKSAVGRPRAGEEKAPRSQEWGASISLCRLIVLGARSFRLRGAGARLRFRWPDYKGDDRAADHDRGDDVESQRVGACQVYDPRDQERTEHAPAAPSGGNEAVDLADVRRAEIVGADRRHGPEAPAVAGDYNEREHGEQQVRRRAEERQQYKEHRLQQEHHEKYPLASDGV